MTLALSHVSISTRRKLTSILLAVTIFALLAGLTSFATRGSIIYAIIDSILVGTGVGLFEQFYVQSLRGRWLRSMHHCCRLRFIRRLWPCCSLWPFTSLIC